MKSMIDDMAELWPEIGTRVRLTANVFRENVTGIVEGHAWRSDGGEISRYLTTNLFSYAACWTFVVVVHVMLSHSLRDDDDLILYRTPDQLRPLDGSDAKWMHSMKITTREAATLEPTDDWDTEGEM